MDYNMNQAATPASGGQVAPMLNVYPEDIPSLSDPTARPDEPITAGLPIGAGPGPTDMDPRLEETRQLKKWLPLIEPFLDQPTVPDSVRSLVKYIKGT
jgi:hypothetical protein